MSLSTVRMTINVERKWHDRSVLAVRPTSPFVESSDINTLISHSRISNKTKVKDKH